MIDLKFTKERFVNHFYYAKWLYIITILAALAVFSMVFTITRPIVPKEFRIDINFIGGSVQEFTKDIWEKDILAQLPEDQQEVNIYSLGIGSGDNPSADYTVYEVLAARMAAKEDDLLIMPKSIYQSLASQGAFIPLDDIAQKYEYAEGIDIEEYKLKYREGIEENDTQLHLFGLPMDNALGIVELGIDPRDKVAVILVYTENKENVLKVLDYLINKTELPNISGE